jgi:hypothetical protein
MKPKIIGIGEILWDLLPSGKQLGGAPANFATMPTPLVRRRALSLASATTRWAAKFSDASARLACRPTASAWIPARRPER